MSILLPAVDMIAVSGRKVACLSADGEITPLSFDEATMRLHKETALCCYAPYIRQRLPDLDYTALDVMELFAFVHPSTFCIPTISGLCHALSLPAPDTLDDAAFSLMRATQALLEHVQHDAFQSRAPALETAHAMGLNGKGWGWTPFIVSALGQTYDPAEPVTVRPLIKALKSCPKWEDTPPRPPHTHHPVHPDEAAQRLADLLHNADKAEARSAQKRFTRHVSQCFDTPAADQAPHITLAEAGTGTGKTLGYLAPASLWAEKNESAVWISTYTKNLQRQIDNELDRLYPIRAEKEAHVAVRKGRENYLCLLNLHDALLGMATAYNPHAAVAAGMMLRWVAASPDGDLTGGTFPGWLAHVLGYAGTLGLADRRGECVFSACDFYKQCFSEHSVRKAKEARIVIANHALVMIQSALSGGQDRLPDRYIFDEGHHLFHAADSAFCMHLTAQETRDLRRWLLGAEGGRQAGRARGLQRRVEDLCAGDETAQALLETICSAAHALTAEGWTTRLKNDTPHGPCETFFHALTRDIYAREEGAPSFYSLETALTPVSPDVHMQALALRDALKTLQTPVKQLADTLMERLHSDTDPDDADLMDSATRQRIESVVQGLEQRGSMMLQGWIDSLSRITTDTQPPSSEERSEWMEITRKDGQAVDVGVFSHWIDPTQPFAEVIAPHLHGMTVTSATLQDTGHDANTNTDAGWDNAFALTGARHLNPNPSLFSAPSPFAYDTQACVLIIDDVNKMDRKQVSGAFQALFTASKGGALGLFTAISRLRSVHADLSLPLEDGGIALYGQHVDAIDTGTLIDMFRFDPDACMLGTDATRDGVDVPGESLRLLVFDRVPWPRPTILHKARRDRFGGRRYDEMLTRLKIKQAFGRLIRRADDKGVFVMLDSALPSRLHDAFPRGTSIIKCGLAEACERIQEFL